MGKWTYTILNVIFFVPVLLFVVKRYSAVIKKEKAFILSAGVFGFIIFFIVDLTATSWGAWGFDYSKTLGLKFGASVIEELVWAILVSIIVAISVAVLADKEDRKEKIHISHLFK